MNTRLLDSPARRISLAVAVLALLVIVGAGLYLFLGTSAEPSVNGPKIVAAASAYTRSLARNHVPIPQTLPLQTLVDKGLLQPADIGALQGLDAKVFLTSTAGPLQPLMTVRMPDGTAFMLTANGIFQRVPH
jgi:hypothetical protein